MMYPYYYGGYGHMAAWGLGGLLLSILFWILIIWLVIAILRRIFWGGRHGRRWERWHEMKGSRSAIEILNERYVRGEINKEEYESKKRDILG